MKRQAPRWLSAPSLLFAAVVLASCSTTPPTQEPAAPRPQPAAAAPAPAPTSAPRDARAGESNAVVTGRSAYYALDQYDVRPEDRATVEANARYLRAHPGVKVRIEGNTDERGSREYNLALGQRRADGVMKMMGLLGVPESRMESVSYGEEKPRAPAHEEAAWSQNRRTDIVY